VLADPPFNRVDLRFAENLRTAVHQAAKRHPRACHSLGGAAFQLRRRSA